MSFPRASGAGDHSASASACISTLYFENTREHLYVDFESVNRDIEALVDIVLV
jgi:hypothetical protein